MGNRVAIAPQPRLEGAIDAVACFKDWQRRTCMVGKPATAEARVALIDETNSGHVGLERRLGPEARRSHQPGDAMAGLQWVETGPTSQNDPERGVLRDALLTLATLGLYQAVTRTRLRRWVWSSLEVRGTPLAYTGTVSELLRPLIAILGFIAVAGLALLIAKLLAVPKPRITPSPWRLLVTIPLVYLLGLTAWRARAWLLERTAVLGARGALAGSPHAYALRHFLTALAVGPTLGWIIPFRQVMVHRQLVDGMRIGPHVFAVRGRARVLLGRFLVAWLLFVGVYLGAVLTLGATMGTTIVTARRTWTWPAFSAQEMALLAGIGLAAGLLVSLIVMWYRAGVLRRLAAMTTLDGAPLHLDMTTAEYLRHALVNGALRLGSLYLLAPHAEARDARFLLSRLRCGAIPLASRPGEVFFHNKG